MQLLAWLPTEEQSKAQQQRELAWRLRLACGRQRKEGSHSPPIPPPPRPRGAFPPTELRVAQPSSLSLSLGKWRRATLLGQASRATPPPRLLLEAALHRSLANPPNPPPPALWPAHLSFPSPLGCLSCHSRAAGVDFALPACQPGQTPDLTVGFGSGLGERPSAGATLGKSPLPKHCPGDGTSAHSALLPPEVGRGGGVKRCQPSAGKVRALRTLWSAEKKIFCGN